MMFAVITDGEVRLMHKLFCFCSPLFSSDEGSYEQVIKSSLVNSYTLPCLMVDLLWHSPSTSHMFIA